MKVSFSDLREQHDGVFRENCPTRTVLDHVVSKWGVLVLFALTDGTIRWGDLRRRIDGISEKMLSSTLRTLEADGLVSRRSYPEVPPRVEYALTDLGGELMEKLGPLMEWVAAHADDIAAAPDARRAESRVGREADQTT
ncbi:winged helix-turn-helix transcriptional regulator [Microbacterium aurantiacum]|uniref:Transcriptional regulator n=1 Tax=Microbacterium aurantiacum TaxID=162393 RepID=A0A0M8MCZ5_9MICO|nr:helix-turn-helix domain-containing protein [Microbacterium chocolatum]ANG84176.1 transcriptional regulator [Microbacterium chocolatum]KOS09866.1 transcriptional regulator [Microbacterium chocolatum]